MNNKTAQTHDQHVHEYVDLGLPSGTLWATENIKDADGNELYFAWGETIGYTAEQVEEGKKVFSWDDYKFGFPDALTKYNKLDGLMILEPEDDAATQNWGDEWKMPTKTQFEELLAGTTQEWTDVNGINGMLCTSKTNGNTVFFPAAGFAKDGGVVDVGGFGDCWSASLYGMDVSRARYFDFFDGYHALNGSSRRYGFPVRPVRI